MVGVFRADIGLCDAKIKRTVTLSGKAAGQPGPKRPK
jgi:hypothetical protein